MRFAALLCGALSIGGANPWLAAQENVQPIAAAGRATGQPVAQPRRRVVVDAVIATVNDSSILLSELRTQAAGTIRANEARVGQLSPQEVQQIYRRELEQRIDEHRLAQSAKSLGTYTPEQVEQLLRMELDQEKRDQVRDLGSYLELSRELQRQGRTWQTYEREQRVGKLSDFAQYFAIYSRLQKQSDLHVTPRMLRETYNINKERFVRPAQARLALVLFRGPTAEADALAAAEIWRREALSSRELAGRFPSAVAMQDNMASSLRPELAEFGLAGPIDSVSAPIPGPGGVQIAKVTQYLPSRNGRFEDQEVQEELRELCQRQVLFEFRQHALERARDRTEVWRSAGAR